MKYIDANKLIHDLEERIYAYSEGYAEGDDNRKDAIETLLKDVKYQLSLQQEQPEVGLEKKFTFPKFLFARTLDNKTMDISYAPQSMEAVEYVRNDFIGQEQPEVDLEKVLSGFTGYYAYENSGEYPSAIDIANHFYELGRKQVLQEIYDGKTKPVDKITAAWLNDKEEDK